MADNHKEHQSLLDILNQLVKQPMRNLKSNALTKSNINKETTTSFQFEN